MSNLDTKISYLLASKEQQKAVRNCCLGELKEMLDLYLWSVMEEEDVIYSLLHQRLELVCHNYNSLKVLYPFFIQIKFLMNLPFQKNQIQIEYGDAGYVKLKLPANVEEEVISSRVWRDACNRGSQNSLLRHINAWKDHDCYLKSSAVLQWFGNAVDKCLNLNGEVPNYNIKRSQSRGQIVLDVEDLKNNLGFTVVLLPVLSFPVSQLPRNLSSVPQNSSCFEWMAECRSNAVSNEQLWGISLWQHERFLIKSGDKLKPLIYVLKCLRDGRKLTLNNYQLRNLVILSHAKNPDIFQSQGLGDILSHLLLQLRDMLVSPEGLPFFWDESCNLLCGLNGIVKSDIARAVSQTRDALQKSDTDFSKIFRLQMFIPDGASTSGSPTSKPSTPSSSGPLPQNEKDQPPKSSPKGKKKGTASKQTLATKLTKGEKVKNVISAVGAAVVLLIGRTLLRKHLRHVDNGDKTFEKQTSKPSPK